MDTKHEEYIIKLLNDLLKKDVKRVFYDIKDVIDKYNFRSEQHKDFIFYTMLGLGVTESALTPKIGVNAASAVGCFQVTLASWGDTVGFYATTTGKVKPFVPAPFFDSVNNRYYIGEKEKELIRKACKNKKEENLVTDFYKNKNLVSEFGDTISDMRVELASIVSRVDRYKKMDFYDFDVKMEGVSYNGDYYHPGIIGFLEDTRNCLQFGINFALFNTEQLGNICFIDTENIGALLSGYNASPSWFRNKKTPPPETVDGMYAQRIVSMGLFFFAFILYIAVDYENFNKTFKKGDFYA